jgi:inosine-uridine nucleoside N-ribohydrolase
VGQHTFPAIWRFLLDFALRSMLPKRSLPAHSNISASELICQQVSASKTPVTFIALGPLTNLALALRADPALATRLDRVFISGGAIHAGGTIHDDVSINPNKVAEWNLYIDPVAADVVFNSGIPLTLIPLDVTHTDGPQPLMFTREFVRRLSVLAHEQAARVMVRIVHLWQLANPQHQAVPVWDAVTAAIAVDTTIGRDWRDLTIRVVLQPKDIAGQTIIDENGQPNTRVCLAGNQAAFEEAYLAIVR